MFIYAFSLGIFNILLLGLSFNTNINFPVCFIVGNEVDGVSEELSELSDIHLEIPMNGIKQSLNVSVATGIIGYELRRKFKLNN